MVAYGAAQFTRDADFWIKPTKKNLVCLQKALKQLKAKPRFLPPLDIEYLRKGHGVHFRFTYREQTFLIDILGKPPRVIPNFNQAYKDANHIEWHELSVPVIDIKRLIATKKTERDKDYTVIKDLVDLLFEEVRSNRSQRKKFLTWLLQELRTPKYLKTITREWEYGKQYALKTGREAAILACSKNATEEEIQAALDKEKEILRKADKQYWKPIRNEIKIMRQEHRKRK
ncbi:MAG: nucleotidyl transferase AbiEii/AbiGii toxin family protein [Deltaproteobacteria bacterium]|nr:nucleotidyl transferase AbiEii/AbiGii toxin family protein [Deltaproteobacteria bacterium]